MIYTLLIILLLEIIFIYLKKWQTKRKILIAICTVIITVIIYVVLLAVLWNSSTDKREDIQQVNEYKVQNFKTILFNNQFNKKVYVIINFEYTKDEIKNNNLKIVDFYNKTDSILLKPNEKNSIFLPVYNNTFARFPINFKVTIKDSVSKVIKSYDEELFYKESKSEPKIEKVQEKYKADEWELIIK